MNKSSKSARDLAKCPKAQQLLERAKFLEREAELLKQCAKLEAEVASFRRVNRRVSRGSRRSDSRPYQDG